MPGRPWSALGVQLEEEALLRREIGGREPVPGAAQRVVGRHAGVVRELRQRVALRLLDRLRDRDEQCLLGPEVVDEHAVAGPDRGGQLAQAQVADPVLERVGDGGFEQPGTGLIRRHVPANVPLGTCTSWYVEDPIEEDRPHEGEDEGEDARENPTLEVEASGITKAAPEVVWPLIEDAARFCEWGPWTQSGYDRPGDDSQHGPGAIRRISLGRTTTIERVLEADPAAPPVVRGGVGDPGAELQGGGAVDAATRRHAHPLVGALRSDAARPRRAPQAATGLRRRDDAARRGLGRTGRRVDAMSERP